MLKFICEITKSYMLVFVLPCVFSCIFEFHEYTRFQLFHFNAFVSFAAKLLHIFDPRILYVLSM